MKVHGKHYRTIWLSDDHVEIIDQRKLPFSFVVEQITTVEEMVRAIADMHVRGAPLIGVVAAFGAYIAAQEIGDSYKDFCPESHEQFEQKLSQLLNARPTAVNLRWALEQQRSKIKENCSWKEHANILKANAHYKGTEVIVL